jgi:hypothetical protein
MPKLGYGYSLYPGSPSSQPSDISGLSLWLKADAGVSTIQENFVSKIVISGSTLPESNGTFIRTSPGGYLYNTLNQDGFIFFSNGNWYLQDYNLSTSTYVNYGTSLNENGWVPDQENYGQVIAKNTITKEALFRVNSWADQSGNKNDVAVPIGGTSPVFESSQINGKPAIYSDGNGKIGLGTDKINLNEFTLFVIQKPFANTARRAFSNIGYDGGNILIGTWENSGNVYTRTCYGGYGWVYQDLSTQQLTWHLDIMTNSTITNLSSYWQDGVNYATDIADVANILDGVSIGADEYYYDNIGSGKIQYAEFVLYNRVLTTTERKQVEGYLNAKYAIY